MTGGIQCLKGSLAEKASLGIHFWPSSRSAVTLLQDVSGRLFEMARLVTFDVIFPLLDFTCTTGALHLHDKSTVHLCLGRAFQLWEKSRRGEALGGTIIVMRPRSAEHRLPLPRLSF